MMPNGSRPSAGKRSVQRRGKVERSAEVHVEVLIIGAGFAGIGTAIRLLQNGFRDVIVIERESEVGGTWRDNTYPGCACDVPSRLYSYSFAPNPSWSRRYASQPEIADYLCRCADDFGVRPHIRFKCALENAEWDVESRVWRVQTSTGSLTASVLVLAQGPLSEPAIPALPGLDSFGGQMFHSARWNHDLDLTGLRVGVVGTGASAIQFIPHVQRQAGYLTVFQRTPPWVTPRHDRAIPAWRQELYRRLPILDRIARGIEYVRREASVPALMGNRVLLDLGRREAESHLRRQVCDPVLRAKLKPSYALGCKRVLLSDDYYPALTQPNVSVVTGSISRIEPGRVITTVADADAEAHDLDVLIFSTGFRVTDGSHQRVVFGSDGRSLEEAWQSSPQAYRGTTVAGFPNLFLMAGPNTGLGHNSLIYMIESQIAYLVGCLQLMHKQRVDAVEVRASVQESYNARLQRLLGPTVWANGGCASWYQDGKNRITTIWPGHTWHYRRETATFDPDAYELTMANKAPAA
ncbi:flavin-containing monooxygenase [Saccharopolyspora shandongensis]|uniref:flavin-containing monooxygenase n=1 Tax=Saccharopolyspora shandongensis TaxID=418495 RepID=UPI0034066A0A